MGADSDSGGEAIVICIDDSTSWDYFNFQVEFVKTYAKYKIKSHPRTVVGVITMTSAPFHLRYVLHPTRDLVRILSSCKSIPIGGDNLDVSGAFTNSLFMLVYSPEIPKGVQKRIVMFAGSYMNSDLKSFPKLIIKNGVAIDVVNFTLGDTLNFQKKNLEAFVNDVNVKVNGKSHIIHVDEGCSVSDLLSSFKAGDEHNKANKKKNKRKANRMMNKHKAKKMKKNKDHQPSLNGVLHSCTA